MTGPNAHTHVHAQSHLGAIYCSKCICMFLGGGKKPEILEDPGGLPSAPTNYMASEAPKLLAEPLDLFHQGDYKLLKYSEAQLGLTIANLYLYNSHEPNSK